MGGPFVYFYICSIYCIGFSLFIVGLLSHVSTSVSVCFTVEEFYLFVYRWPHNKLPLRDNKDNSVQFDIKIYVTERLVNAFAGLYLTDNGLSFSTTQKGMFSKASVPYTAIIIQRSRAWTHYLRMKYNKATVNVAQ